MVLYHWYHWNDWVHGVVSYQLYHWNDCVNGVVLYHWYHWNDCVHDVVHGVGFDLWILVTSLIYSSSTMSRGYLVQQYWNKCENMKLGLIFTQIIIETDKWKTVIKYWSFDVYFQDMRLYFFSCWWIAISFMVNTWKYLYKRISL